MHLSGSVGSYRMGLVRCMAESTCCRKHGKDEQCGSRYGPAHGASLPVQLPTLHPTCHPGGEDGEPGLLCFHSVLSLICTQQ